MARQNSAAGFGSNELMIAAGDRGLLMKRQNCIRQVRRERAQEQRRARRARRVRVAAIKLGFG